MRFPIRGINVVGNNLKDRSSSVSSYNGFILDLLRFILTRNVFLFGLSHYFQVQGVAMGTMCAPSYANLYLGGWEKELFSRDDISMYLSHVISWYRYIDDILLLWSGSKAELAEFMTVLADNSYNLKFTMECNQECIHFWDLKIFVDSDGFIYSSLYRKPSSGNTILHATSGHSYSLIKSIPYSQYIQLKRNCAQSSDYEMAAKKLSHRLRDRGYSHKILKKDYNRAAQQNQQELIISTKTKTYTWVITQYSKHHSQFRSILNQFWPLLLADDTVVKCIQKHPDITYRRAPSLRDKSVHSHYNPPGNKMESSTGTFPCKKCNICEFILAGTIIPLPNGQTHSVRHRVSCQTIGVVYLAKCLCGCFYVGKTKRPFYKRIKDHVDPTRKRLMTTTVSRHLGREHNFALDMIKFTALEHVPAHARGGGIDRTLLQLETKWIQLLNATRYPGLNQYISFKSFL